MPLQPFSNDELNFFKFASLVLNEFPEALRQIFVDMWDKRIAPLSRYQPWDDSAAVRNMLLHNEGPKTKIPTNTSFQDWDCTALFRATLYAKTFAFPDSKGNMKTLSELFIMNRIPPPHAPFHPIIASPTGDPNETIALAIDQLRILRNTLCHSSISRVNKATFDQYVQYAKEAFTAVGLCTISLEAIGNLPESDFPTTKVEELKERIQKERDFNEFLKSDVKDGLDSIKVTTDQTNKKVDEITKKFDELSMKQYTAGETKEQNGICVLPLMPCHHVINREATVRKFCNTMKELRENNPDTVTSFYISGNPGCGKTQFARLLGEAMYADKCFSFVFTLDASSSDSFYSSMFNLAVKLGWSPEYIEKEVPEKGNFHTKFQKLCSLVGVKANSRKHWLLIVDSVGVCGLEKEMKFWRNAGIQNWGAGQVIITTQCEDDIPEGEKVLHERFQKGLEEDEAIDLLQKIASEADEDDIHTLKQVATQLNYQPLALVNAATYTHRVSKINRSFKWVNYLDKLLAGKQEEMEATSAKKIESYPLGMVIATRLAVEELFNSSEILKYVFFALGFCAHAPVPVDLLVSYVKSKIGDVDNDDVLVALQECCLFLWREKFEVDTLTVHQVIYQQFLELQNKHKDIISAETLFRIWLDTMENFTKQYVADEVVARMFTMLSLVKPHLPKIQTTTSSQKDLYSFIPPITNSLCRAEYQSHGFLMKLDAFRVVYEKVYDCRNLLKYEHAVLQIQRVCHDIPDSEVAITLQRIGLVFCDMGDQQKAEQHFLKSLEMQKSFYGESAPNIYVAIFRELESGYITYGDLQIELEEHYLKCLRMKNTFYGESAPGIDDTMHMLGITYFSRGDLQKAEEHFLKSLEMKKSFYGKIAPGIDVTLDALGSVYLCLADLQKAEEHLLKSLEMKKSLYGESAPDIAATLHSLGSVYLSRADLQKAEEHFLKSLELKKSFYGESAPSIAFTLLELGKIYLTRGDLQKAEEHFLKSLEMKKSFYGESAPGIANTVHALGNVYLSRGDLQKAEEHFLKSLEMEKSFYGESAPGIAVTVHELGRVYFSGVIYRKIFFN